MQKIKILHVLSSPRAEGTPRLVLDWLISDTCEQGVLFLNNKPEDLLSSFKNLAGAIFINKKLHSGFRKIVQIIILVRKIVLEFKPDLLISWNQGNAQYIILGSYFGGNRNNIVHVGCAPEYRGIYHLFYTYLVFLPIYFLKGKVICASQYIKNEFNNLRFLPRKNIMVIPNCFNVNSFKMSDRISSTEGIICVGNLEKTKDHILLIRSFRKLVDIGVDQKLIIVGGGSQKKVIENLVEKLNLTEKVTLTGAVNDVGPFLKKASVFVFTSFAQEGFGTVLLEALAAGLQIVSVDIPAAREVLNNGEYGILVHARNPNEIAIAIKRAFDNPISWDQRQKNLNYASSFTPERMMNKYLRTVGLTVVNN